MPEALPPLAQVELPAALSSEVGLRLDVFLSGRVGGTRSHLQRLVREVQVLVGGRPTLRPSQVIREGDLVTVAEEAPRPGSVQPPPAVRRVYEDELVMVVDKPAGMVVHPGPGHRDGTLAQLLQSWGGPWATAGGEDRAPSGPQRDGLPETLPLHADHAASVDDQAVSIAYDDTPVAHLAAHFGIERGFLEDDLELVTLLHDDQSIDFPATLGHVERLRRLWDEGKASGPAEPFDVERTLAAARARLKDVAAE